MRKLTTEPSTERHYWKVARGIFFSATGVRLVPSDPVDPKALVRGLQAIEESVTSKTFGSYKAAVKWVLRHISHPDCQAALTFLDAACSDARAGDSVRKEARDDIKAARAKRPKYGAAKKVKFVTPEQLNDLRIALNRTASNNGIATRNWLFAGILTGLRPCEWRGAELGYNPKGVLELRVKNAKATNDRAHGPFRTLEIGSDVPPLYLAALFQHVRRFRTLDTEEKYRHFYHDCRTILKRCNQAVFKNAKHYVTLYSGRHQCCADMKSSNFSDEQTAAALGHRSIATAMRHYGRACRGTGHAMVRPIAADVLRVKAHNVFRDRSALRPPAKTKIQSLSGLDPAQSALTSPNPWRRTRQRG